jgi:hypothetical protein
MLFVILALNQYLGVFEHLQACKGVTAWSVNMLTFSNMRLAKWPTSDRRTVYRYGKLLQYLNYLGVDAGRTDPFIISRERCIEVCMLHDARKKEPRTRARAAQVKSLGIWGDSSSK